MHRDVGWRFSYDSWKKEKGIHGDRDIYFSLEELEEISNATTGQDYRILGKISKNTAKNWRNWNIGELYVVVGNGRLYFCMENGYVV